MKEAPFTLAELATQATSLVTQSRRVRFQDVDAAGTIYFARVFDLFGDAYVELLDSSGLDVPAILRAKKWAAPLAHAEADYRAPLFFGDAITVEIVRAHAGSSSLTLGHRVTRADGAVAALGMTVHVFVDGATFKPTPVPDELRARISRAG
jgi:YbgC/YbaW family acyl-CoA thioester hydrolase